MVSREGDLTVVRVENTMIYESDVQRAALAQNKISNDEVLQLDDAAYHEVLNELIDQRLLKLEALKQGMNRAPEVTRQLSEARERILATYLVEQKLKNAVTEDALREIYKSQSVLRQNAVEANVRLIRVKTQEDMKSVVQKLSGGADFGELARELSTETTSGKNNGELGFVSRVMIDSTTGDVVFSTKAGTLSKPFETKEGWNIVEVVGFRKPQHASFESMRAQLLAYKTYTEVDDLMTKIREQSDVEVLVKTDGKLLDEAENE